MSIDREDHRIVFLCDGKKCNEFLQPDTDEFSEAKQELDEAGWATRKINNEWVHICPECLESETSGLVL